MTFKYESYDAAQVREKTERVLATLYRDDAINDEVADALQSFDGKKPSKRMANAVEKRLGEGYRVYWNTDFSWHEIVVWKDGTPYDERYRVVVMYLSEGATFNYEQWNAKHNHQAGEYSYTKKIKAIEAKLPQTRELVAKYNEAMQAAREAYAAMNGLATW